MCKEVFNWESSLSCRRSLSTKLHCWVKSQKCISINSLILFFVRILWRRGQQEDTNSRSCDAELDDELIGKALSSPLFVQEWEEPANLKRTFHSLEESLLPAQSFFTRTSTGRPVYEPRSDLYQKQKSSRDLENERIRILLERQEEQILA